MQKLLTSLTPAVRYRALSSEVERLAAFKYMKADFGVHQCASVSSASLPCAREVREERSNAAWMLVFDVNHNSNPCLPWLLAIGIQCDG